jgi:hypothetical protein
MTPPEIAGTPSARAAREATSLKIGGTCALVGAVAFGIVRMLHGDTPGADAAASLTFVATRPIYAGVHIAAVFAALLILAGLISLAGTFTHPIAWTLGRFGVATSLVGVGQSSGWKAPAKAWPYLNSPTPPLARRRISRPTSSALLTPYSRSPMGRRWSRSPSCSA